MKISKWLGTTALLITLAASASAYAQDAGAPDWKAKRQHREEVLAQLPAEKAKLYRDAMQGVYDKNKPLREQVEKMHADIKTLMTADKFDKEAYLSKNAEMEKLYNQMRVNTTEALASVAAQYTVDERKILIQLRPEPAKRDNESPKNAK